MNIVSRLISTIIIIFIFIIPIFLITNFDLPFLGDHRILISNLFFDTESQYLQYIDDVSLEIDDFKSEAIRIAIYIIAGLWLVLSYVWIFYSDTRKVFRPGEAKKYKSFWVIFLVLINVITLVVCWYFFFQQSRFNGYMSQAQFFQLGIFIVLYSSLYYYLSSLFITSSAMRTAVPFAEKLR